MKIKRVLTLILACIMLCSYLPADAIASLISENDGKPHFSENVISLMQEVVGDKYDAEEVLQALYERGLVDETGVPVLSDTFVVDGKTVTAEELRDMAYDHVTDAEDTTVVVDGSTVTWSQLRSLFAIRDMNEALAEAQRLGIAMNDDQHIELSNNLLSWLSGATPNSDADWNKVSRVGHYNAIYIDANKKPSYWCVASGNTVGVDLAGEYDIGKGKSSTEGLYHYYEERDSYGNVITRASRTANINYLFTSNYSSDYPDRLWFPSVDSDGKFYYEDAKYGLVETTLKRTSYSDASTGLEYDGRYEYLAEIGFQMNIRDILSASGYDPEKVRVILHAESADDLLNFGGNVELFYVDDYGDNVGQISSIALTDENCTALLNGGIDLGVIEMEEYDSQSAVGFNLRASDNARTTSSTIAGEEQGRVRPAGLYFTFEVMGDTIAPAANKYNNRLWLVPVSGKTDVYTLNTEYHGYLYGGSANYGSGYRVDETTEITLKTDIIREADNGDLYIDLADEPYYILNSVLRSDTAEEQNMSVLGFNAFSDADTHPNSVYGRLFLDPIDPPYGTQYHVNVDAVKTYYPNDQWKYNFDEDMSFEISDSEIINTLTYSFIDYNHSIQSFTAYVDGMLDAGALTVGSSGAKQEYLAKDPNKSSNSHSTSPLVMWDSVNREVHSFKDYGTFYDKSSQTISYTRTGDRAVLAFSRFLNYMNPFGEATHVNGSVSYNHLTETPWVISQYGIYNVDNENEYTHYDLGYNSNIVDEQNLHIVAPAMTYYPGEVIPLIVTNPNGVFDTVPGKSADAREAWVKENYTLTINNKVLTPAEVSIRKDTNKGYGIDMIVFLFEVGDVEGGQLSFQIGKVTISNDGETQVNLVTDMGESAPGVDNLATMMTPDLGAILDMDGYSVITENGVNYLDIPLRTDLTDIEIGEIIQQITSWTTAPTEEEPRRIFNNAFAIANSTGHPRGSYGDSRLPIYAIQKGETYEGIRFELPTADENGARTAFARIYVGSSVSSNEVVYEGYNLGFDLESGEYWTCEGIQCTETPYRRLSTLIINLPKSVYFEDESDISLIYNNEWARWSVSVDEETGEQTGGLKYSDYQKRGLNGTNDIVLSYKTRLANGNGEEYSYTGAENFTWKSNKPEIATITNVEENGVKFGVVIPTGIPGTVTFTLVCENGGGDHVIEIETLSLTVVDDNNVPYLRIPATLSPVLVRKNEACNVPFASNLQQFNEIFGNQKETEFTVKLYEAELSGGKLVKSSDTPVYTGKEKATASSPITAITIPENTLVNVSPTGSESYIAEVSADFFTGEHEILPADIVGGHFSAEVPIKVKNYPVRVSISSESNGYLLGGQEYTASWAIQNNNDTYDWKYFIADENGNILSSYEKTGSDSTFDATSLTFTAPEVTGVLKHTYVLTVAASNDVSEEGWSIAVKTIYVYNKDALDILVESVEGKVTVDGDKVTMDSRAWLEQYLSADGKTVKLGTGGISFGDLQTDAHIDTLISLNYGAYEWGLISDAIEWKVTPKENSENGIDFYYEKMGIFSDTKTSGLTSYIPTKDFRLIAINDGEVTVTATHAMSGISTSVEVDVDVMDNELVLFQFYPAVKTKVTYTLDGNDVTVYSDDNGQLALYEAIKLDNDTRFYVSSTYSDTDYVGMTTMSELKSGERNALNGRTYPVNLVKLQRPAELHLYFNDEKGEAISSKTFTVRGGVFYDGVYAEHADLFNVNNKSLPDVAGDRSSGLDDLEYTTDENGMFKVFFNMEQFTANGELDPGKDLEYVFEVKLDGYQPEIVIVNPYDESNVVTALTPITDDEKEKPYIWDFNVGSYDGTKFQNYLMLDEASTKIGPNYKQSAVTFEINTALWGVSDLLTVGSSEKGVSTMIAKPGSQYFVDEGTTVVAGNGGTKAAQKYEFWMYPFSSFVFCNTVFRADAYDDSITWLDEKTEHPMDLCLFDENGEEVTTFDFDYVLYKNMDAKEIVESEEMKRKMEEQKEMIKENTKDFGLGNLVPGGDILATGLTFLTSSVSGGNYGVHFKVTPTADPAVYYIMISLSDEAPEDDEEEDKKLEIQPEYEDIQALGKEAISGIMGTHKKNYASKMDGLAGTLKKESERIYKVGELNLEDGYDDDKEEEEELPFTVGGSILTRATYDLETNDWSLSVCGGSAHLKWNIAEWDYHKNILVFYVPLTVSVGIKLDIKGEFQALTTKEEGKDYDTNFYKTSVTLKAEMEGFAGVGLDVSVIAIKIGFYGKFEPTATAEFLIADRLGSEQKLVGGNINLKGELGMKFVFKALVVDLEYELCSFLKYDEGKDFNFGAYEQIEKTWKGAMKGGGNYTASMMPNGQISYTLQKTSVAKKYLAPATTPGSTIFKKYSDGAEIEDIVITEDGKKVFYLDDGVAFEASLDGIAGQALAEKQDDDYGQFYLDAAGYSDYAAAAWVTQTAPSEFEDTDAPTATEIAAVMNSSEITAAVYDLGTKTWTTTRLTANTAPDLAPVVAVSANGTYVLVAWRSLYNSDINQPLVFDVDDNIMYSIYNRKTKTWSEPAIAYNGIANGSVYALDAAIFNNGNVLIGYTVSTDIGTVDEEKNESGLETFYTFLENTTDGMVNTTVRLTDNRSIDANAQIHNVYDGTTQYSVLGWYSGEDDGDIHLRLFDENGSIDSKYPSSISEICDERISSNFRLAGYKKSNLTIGWTNQKDKADDENVASSELCAVRMYEDEDGNYRVGPEQKLSSSSKSCTVDDFALYFDGYTVTAILAETDYSAGKSEVSGVLTVDDYVRLGLYSTEEEYLAARESFMEEYPNGLEVTTPVGDFRAEKVSAGFKNDLEITDIYWNQDTVAPNLTVPVQITVKNNGYSTVEGIDFKAIYASDAEKIRVTKYCAKQQTIDVTLAPGESKTISINCAMNGDAEDAIYTISPSNGGFDTKEGTILFNTPEIEILDSKQTSAENGKRSLSIRLGNRNMVPAGPAMRDYRISVYQDPEFTNLLAEYNSDSFDYDLLDENALTLTIPDIDVARIMSYAGMSGSEIPGSGIPLYIKVDTLVLNSEYEQTGEIAASTYDVVFISTLCKDAQNPLVIDCPDFTVSGNEVTGSYTIDNTSIYSQDVSEYAVVARNADGLIVAMQLLPITTVGKEKSYSGDYTFTFTDPSEVASINVETISDSVLPELTAETHQFGGWYKSDTFDTEVEDGDLTGYAKWYVGLEITVSDSVEHGTIAADIETAVEGATVTLTATPVNGYALDSFTVTDAEGNTVTVSDDNTFVMPASPVTVTASFKREAYNTVSMSLSDAIGLYFRLDTDFYDVDTDTAYVKLTYDHSTDPKSDIRSDIILLSDAKKETDGRYMFEVALAPAQITEAISIELFANETDADPVLSMEYSIADYCLSAEENLPEIANICKALRAYGAACQVAFGVNKDNLAEDDYAWIVSGYNADNVGDYELTNGATGVNVTAMSLDVQNKMIVRYKLTLDDDADPDAYSVSLSTSRSNTNAHAELEYDSVSGKFYALVKGLEGPNLDMTYTLTITNESDGTKTEIKDFCALNYAKKTISSETGGAVEDVVRGMCMFNLWTNAYFIK